MGTPLYAAMILDALLCSREVEVVGVVTQPDKKVGRGQKVKPSAIKALLLEKGFSGCLWQPLSLSDEVFLEQMIALKPDLIVVAAYGKILPKVLLDLAPCYNLHASILPKYRGASPVQETLLAGDRFAGVTLMQMEQGLDCGACLAMSVILVDEDCDSVWLFDSLARLARDLMMSALKRLKSLQPLPQIGADASYCHKIKKEEGCVSFDCAKEVVRKIKAYAFSPGVFLASGLKIKRASLHSKEGAHKSGEILEICKNGVVVGCLEGALLLEVLQPPSKKEMAAVAYIHGKRLSCGDTLF